jgi:hypothetical protein
LAGGDILKWDIVMQMPYNKVLTKLLLSKTEMAYQRKYAELLKKEEPKT